jgi:hypothetical protein
MIESIVEIEFYDRIEKRKRKIVTENLRVLRAVLLRIKRSRLSDLFVGRGAKEFCTGTRGVPVTGVQDQNTPF